MMAEFHLVEQVFQVTNTCTNVAIVYPVHFLIVK